MEQQFSDEYIEQFVDELLAKKAQQYFQRIRFNKSIHLHAVSNGDTRGCGCEICTKKYEYVQAKISLHRAKKKLDLCGDVMPETSIKEIDERISFLQKKVSTLKTRYHALQIGSGYLE
jgi:hypothetical protein